MTPRRTYLPSINTLADSKAEINIFINIFQKRNYNNNNYHNHNHNHNVQLERSLRKNVVVSCF